VRAAADLTRYRLPAYSRFWAPLYSSFSSSPAFCQRIKGFVSVR